MSEITVFTAAKIHTMNLPMPNATAVAVRDGMIIEVGTLETLRPWLDAHPHRIDDRFLDNILLPGFIDPHLHPSMAAILLPMHFITAMEWRLPDRVVPPVRGHNAYFDRLKEIENSLSDPIEPLMTWGYHQIWHGRMNRASLNAISTERPIVVWQRSYHEIIVNDAALSWMDLDAEELARHPQIDVAEGRFFESGKAVATSAMSNYLLAPERFIHGLKLTKNAVQAGGHTTIADLTGGLFDNEEEWEALSDILDNDDTPFRVQMIPAGNRKAEGIGTEEDALKWVQSRAERNTDRLFYRDHVKLFADGGFFAELMQVQEPGFIDGHHGEWLMPPEFFESLARTYWNAGYKIHVHCTGDLGVELALDVLEKLQWERPRVNHRFTIEHFGLSTPEQVRRIADLGALVSCNIYYVHELGDAYWKNSIGYERASQMSRLGTLAHHNVTTALHSDFTMAPAQPLYSAWVAVNRLSENGEILAPTERISLNAALQAITINAAYVLGMENEIGSIRAGKKADFTVLGADPFEIPTKELKDIPILGTVFEGTPYENVQSL